MKIIPIEFELEYWKGYKKAYHTFRFAILHFDWCDGDACLLELGWYQGVFVWDILFLDYFYRRWWL
jgi:hypothetical protein